MQRTSTASNVTERVATAVRLELARRDLKSAAIAEILPGFNRTTIWRKLRGQIAFSIEEIDALAAAWDIPVSQLIPEEQAAA